MESMIHEGQVRQVFLGFPRPRIGYLLLRIPLRFLAKSAGVINDPAVVPDLGYEAEEVRDRSINCLGGKDAAFRTQFLWALLFTIHEGYGRLPGKRIAMGRHHLATFEHGPGGLQVSLLPSHGDPHLSVDWRGLMLDCRGDGVSPSE